MGRRDRGKRAYFHKHYITEVETEGMNNTGKHGKQDGPLSLWWRELLVGIGRAVLEPMALMMSTL
jgi:hypothetical protein